MAECCAELGMLAVQCAELDDTLALAALGAIEPLTFVGNAQHADVGKAESARELWMGGKAHVLIEGIARETPLGKRLRLTVL